MKRSFLMVCIAAFAGCLFFASSQASAFDPPKFFPKPPQPKFVPKMPPKVMPLPENPFVQSEGAYSASISMMPDGSARINWWGRLNGGVKFEDLKTFGSLPNVAELPTELQPYSGDIIEDRVLPWYVVKDGGVWKRIPIVTQCQVVKRLQGLAPSIGPTILCTEPAPVALTVDPTKAQVIQQLKSYYTSAASPHRFYFEDAQKMRSPQMLFADLIANGEALGDEDGDGIYDAFDNCPTLSNPDQKDSNDDGEGDACMFAYTPPPPPADSDGDSFPDDIDTCPEMDNYPNNADTDGDGVGDMCDACPDEPGLPEYDGCPRKLHDVAGDSGMPSSGESDVVAGGMDGGGACSLVQPAISSYVPFILALLGCVPGLIRRRRKK